HPDRPAPTRAEVWSLPPCSSMYDTRRGPMSACRHQLLLMAAVALSHPSAGRTQPPPAAATPAAPAELRPVTVPVEAAEMTNYNKKWAVVVGTNYPKAARPAALGRITELKHARNDAEEFHSLLVNCFGYGKDEAVLLTDEHATHDEVARRLKEGLFLSAD